MYSLTKIRLCAECGDEIATSDVLQGYYKKEYKSYQQKTKVYYHPWCHELKQYRKIHKVQSGYPIVLEDLCEYFRNRRRTQQLQALVARAQQIIDVREHAQQQQQQEQEQPSRPTTTNTQQEWVEEIIWQEQLSVIPSITSSSSENIKESANANEHGKHNPMNGHSDDDVDDKDAASIQARYRAAMSKKSGGGSSRKKKKKKNDNKNKNKNKNKKITRQQTSTNPPSSTGTNNFLQRVVNHTQTNKKKKETKNQEAATIRRIPHARPWQEYQDPHSGKKYYSNGSTTTWTKPQTLTKLKKKKKKKTTATAEAAAAVVDTTPSTQTNTTKTTATTTSTTSTRTKLRPAATPLTTRHWTEYADPTTKKAYYATVGHDGRTITTWTKPDLFVPDTQQFNSIRKVGG